MSVNYRFTCDACGKTGEGVAGQYVHPDPPLGWTWRFSPGLESPHACSAVCWAAVTETAALRLLVKGFLAKVG